MLLAAVLMLFSAVPVYAAQSVFMPSQSYAEGQYYQNLLDVELTGDPRQDVVNIALSQLGYTEGGREGQYSGYSRVCNNFSEYGRAMGKGGSIWCTSFIWWCVRQAGIDASVFPDTIWPRLLTINCPYVGYTSDAAIRPGDILFVENTGDDTPDHLSLVTEVTDTEIIGIEGNCGNRVCMMRYNRAIGARPDGMGVILYIGYLNYDKDPSVPDASSMLQYALITSDAPLYNKHTGGEHQGTIAAGQICPLLEVRGDGAWCQIEVNDLAYWTDPSCVYTGSMDSVLEQLVATFQHTEISSESDVTDIQQPVSSTSIPEAEGTGETTTEQTDIQITEAVQTTPASATAVSTQNNGLSELLEQGSTELYFLLGVLLAVALIFVILLIKVSRRDD